MLTRRQRELLDFLQAYEKKHRYCPSHEECMRALKLHSKSGIHRIVKELEQRGFVRRLPHKARAIEVLSPQQRLVSCEHCGKLTRVETVTMEEVRTKKIL